MATNAAPVTLSVVVPLCNEEENVAPLVERVAGILEGLPEHPTYEPSW